MSNVGQIRHLHGTVRALETLVGRMLAEMSSDARRKILDEVDDHKFVRDGNDIEAAAYVLTVSNVKAASY